MFLIKNNHVDRAGSITAAVERIRAKKMPQLVMVEVRNRGHEDHAFRIYGHGLDRATRVIEPMMRTSLTVTLVRGVYRVECPVKEPEEREDHAAMGMTGMVRVY